MTGENEAPVPILGPPGIGKSTLAVVALYDGRVLTRYGKRRYFIRCDGARSAKGVIDEIARVLRTPLGSELRQAVLRELERRPAVLVLDNFETPWEADEHPARELLRELAAIAGLRLIVAMRGSERPFGVSWSEPIRLFPLILADAREAFLAVTGGKFAADPLLDTLIEAVERVPLAITLLAHRAQPETDLKSVYEQWRRKKADLLEVPGASDREANFGASLELSIRCPRMDDAARDLLALLSRLPAGMRTVDIQEQLGDEALDAASTLRCVALAFDEEARLRLLAPVREYVEAHHSPSEGGLARLMQFNIALARLGGKAGREGGAAAIARLTPELPNLEAMLEYALSTAAAGDAISAARDLGILIRFSGLGTDRILHKARAAAKKQGDVLGEANCIKGLGDIALARSDHDLARARYEEALPLYRRVGSVQGEANCIESLGDIALRRSDHDQARSRYEEALPLYRRVGSVQGEAVCIARSAEISLNRSDHNQARAQYEEALPLFRRVGDVLGEANCIMCLGDIALRRSDHDPARSRYEEALPLYRRVGDMLGEANCIRRLGDIALRRSDHDQARVRYQEALALYERIPEPYSIGMTHLRLARIARSPAEKARHLAAVRENWKRIGRSDLLAELDAEFGPPADEA